MGQLLCAQQDPYREAAATSNEIAREGPVAAYTERNRALPWTPAETAGGASALQCGPSSPLSTSDAAALFGHYSNAETHASTDAGRDESINGQIHLNPAQVRQGARTIREALGSSFRDPDA